MNKINYRVTFDVDEYAEFEECNGKREPLSEAEYAENAYVVDGVPVPYADYLTYQGNADRHVFLYCRLEKECPCCGTWKPAGSLSGIDMMDDSPELRHIAYGQPIPSDQVSALPETFRDIARELLSEVSA